MPQWRDFLGDLSYATRAFGRSPGFALLAIGIMALGIGANTAVFSVVNAVLLKPLPYPGSDRIVTLRTALLPAGDINPLVSLANFRDWRDRSSSFEAMATYRGGEAPVSPGTTAEYVQHANVDGQFFRVFAVEPVLGRPFAPDELVPGNEQPSVIISHAYWQSRFGGSPGVLGQKIQLGNGVWSIVGVMPPDFHVPNRTDIWSPQTRGTASRTSHNLFAFGRLKPGISLQQGQAELGAIAADLERQYPDSNKGRGVALTRLQDQLVGDVRLTLYLLWGVVGVVLLIACANTATLLLGKATARTREIGVRAALGASRGRIVRQLITESFLLAFIAGYTGMLLAYWGAKVLLSLTPADVVRRADTSIDMGVLGFTLAVTLATSVLTGLVPALYASKVDLIDALKQAGTRSLSHGRALRTRGLLVVSEIALAVVLLIGAGLLIKSLMALHNVDLGYQPENVLVMKATGVRARPENDAAFKEIVSRIAAVPGVVSVGAMMTPPGDLNNAASGAYFIDRMPETRDRTKDPFAFYNVIAPGTFRALGIPLKSGRDFDEGDTADRPPVAIVNEALVQRSFGGQTPIGRTLFCSFDRKEGMTIVGVVGNVRQNNPAIQPVPDCYMPYQQHAYNNNTLYVVTRTAGEPEALAATLRRVVAEVSPTVPVSFKTMDAMVAERKENPSFRALLFGVFAAVAVTLAMAGVFGVTAYGVEQRSKEIGLRMALGASSAAVLRLVLRQGLVLAAAGLALGLAGAVAATRLLRTVLFEVQPLDVSVYVAGVLLLGVVTLIASYVPARRAAVVDPMVVLKTE